MATNVKTASVTLICSSPSRERRQASTWNFMDVRPVGNQARVDGNLAIDMNRV
jgi:hypothetical protein